ncbi:MAG: IS66 family insertion sequence element accessory protein TnpB [Candidatus Accumulibacter sp. UW20]|jgi:hypothetical protein
MSKNGQELRLRRSADDWQGLLSRFAGSGLSVTDFCAQEGISDTSFHRWRGRLGGAGAEKGTRLTASSPSAAFVDVGALREGSPPSRLELTLDLGGGLQLHLVRG